MIGASCSEARSLSSSIKISKFSQIRKALIDELKVWLVSLSVIYFVHSQENDPPKGKVHNCFSSGNEGEKDEEVEDGGGEESRLGHRVHVILRGATTRSESSDVLNFSVEF